MKLLMTGFEPAIGIRRTPSGELAKLWASEDLLDGAEVRAVVLQQVFRTCVKQACVEIDAFRPDCVLMYGAVPTNDFVRVERFALNVEHTVMGDNTKIPVHDRPIVQGGPAAYETTLPYERLLGALDAGGVRARLSFHAGTHTCNDLMYGVLHYLRETGRSAVPAGFIHVPFPMELAFGVVEEEAGLMRWSEIRRASVIVAQAMAEYLSERPPPL